MKYRLGAAAIMAGLASACTLQPTVTKTQMKLADVNMEGMECRRDLPPGTNIPRTVCATEEAWNAYDARRREDTEELLAKGREIPNVGRGNRPN